MKIADTENSKLNASVILTSFAAEIPKFVTTKSPLTEYISFPAPKKALNSVSPIKNGYPISVYTESSDNQFKSSLIQLTGKVDFLV